MPHASRILFPLLTVFLLGLFTQCRETAETTSDAPPLPRLDSLLLTPNGVEKLLSADAPMATLW